MRCLTGRLAVLVMTGIMGALAPMTALASSPEFSRNTEEWERLRDNVLEYEEIADLIHEYNSTVQNNQYEYNKFIKDYGMTREDIADEYLNLADDLEASMTGDEGLAMVSDFQLQQQAKRLREQADDNLEDSQIYYWEYCQAEDNLVLSAQSRFLSYYGQQLELETAEETKKDLETAYDQTVLSRQAGMATEMEVLDAQEAVQEQEKTIAELKQSIENTRQNLVVLCGWSSDSQPEISPVPELDLEKIDEIDLEADKQTALETNYTLKINNKKQENAKDPDNRDNIQKTIDSNKRQIGLSVTSAWQSLQTARRSYEQALKDEEAGKRDLELADQKRAAGMITEAEYQKEQSAANADSIAVRIAYLDLIEAYETYWWNVNGMAGAE